MSRVLKWSLSLAAAAVTFVACLWLAIEVASQTLPHVLEADRWVAAAAFATVMSTAAGVCTGWWAGRERPSEFPPTPPQTPHQSITAEAPGAIAQGAQFGNIYNHSAAAGTGPAGTPASAGDDGQK